LEDTLTNTYIYYCYVLGKNSPEAQVFHKEKEKNTIYILIEKFQYTIQNRRNNYLLSLLRKVKGDKISYIQNNTDKSKQVLATDITVLSLRGSSN